MNKYILSLIFILSFTASHAQHEADNWYFGLMAGINFSSGTAVAQYGGVTSNTEGCSSISDASGNLLFYTDGVYVWNKNHQQMPNGSGLHGSTSSTQSALVVPKPGSTTEYYIFTVDEIGGPNGFEYSIVDMTLDGGLGDVSTLNVHVLDYVTEKLTAVRQVNTGNYWIAVHEWGTDAFYVYLLTSAGLQSPVLSHTGIVHDDSQIQYTYGQMKFNPCGNMIGAAIGYLDTVQVFPFDNATGTLSHSFTLPIGAHCYGLDFSPDGSKLYVSTYDALGTLVQYKLDVLVEDSIRASKIALSVLEDTYGIQLGPDGKVYVCRSFSQYLGVVNNPDLPGFSCNYDNYGFDLDPSFNGVSSALSLPGFVTSWLLKDGDCLFTSVPIADNSETIFSVFPNPASGQFNISLNGKPGIRDFELRIYDVTGREVYKQPLQINSKLSAINCHLNTGLYSVMLNVSDGSSFMRKLIIK
jgi:hypothetical protein